MTTSISQRHKSAKNQGSCKNAKTQKTALKFLISYLDRKIRHIQIRIISVWYSKLKKKLKLYYLTPSNDNCLL